MPASLVDHRISAMGNSGLTVSVNIANPIVVHDPGMRHVSMILKALVKSQCLEYVVRHISGPLLDHRGHLAPVELVVVLDNLFDLDI